MLRGWPVWTQPSWALGSSDSVDVEPAGSCLVPSSALLDPQPWDEGLAQGLLPIPACLPEWYFGDVCRYLICLDYQLEMSGHQAQRGAVGVGLGSEQTGPRVPPRLLSPALSSLVQPYISYSTARRL